MPAFSLVFGELMEALNDPDPIVASEKTMDESWIFLWVAFGIFGSTFFNVAFFELLAERQRVVPLVKQPNLAENGHTQALCGVVNPQKVAG